MHSVSSSSVEDRPEEPYVAGLTVVRQMLRVRGQDRKYNGHIIDKHLKSWRGTFFGGLYSLLVSASFLANCNCALRPKLCSNGFSSVKATLHAFLAPSDRHVSATWMTAMLPASPATDTSKRSNCIFLQPLTPLTHPFLRLFHLRVSHCGTY